MDWGQAWTMFRLEVQPDVAPALTPHEQHAIIDAAGRAGAALEDPNWTTRARVWMAVAQAFRAKRAKVVGAYDFSTDGQSFSRSQMYKMLEQAEAKALLEARASSQGARVGKLKQPDTSKLIF